MNVSSHLDLIDALAAHFQSSGSGSTEKHGTLQVPFFLRKTLSEKLNPPKGPGGKARVLFAAEEIKKLVRSISEEDFERWCLLDDTAFTFVTRILLEAAPCLAKDQGLFRMIEALETLNNENSDLAMPKELLVDYKGAVGGSLVAKLLTYFVEAEESDLSRRWIGLLLVELLGDSEINRERIWEIPKETLKNIGEIIISGADRMLKIVAGKIIWQMMLGFGDEEEIRHRLAAFCHSSEASDFTKDFPLQDGSQWENGFASFITDMEEERYDLDIGLPTGYNGYQVKIGDDNPINTEFGVISISIAEIFSIYIPPNRDRSPDWVDFKIVNISKIESTNQGVTGDAMKDFTYFKLHLCDYEEDGYLYLLSMRPSSYSDNVMVLCYKTDADDFAEDVKRCKSKVLKRMSNRLTMSSAPVKDIQANPTHHQSQQAKLDELERHRDDILKVLESPGRSRSSPKSATDLDGGGDSLVLPVNGGGRSRGSEEKKTQRADLTEVEGESNGSGFRDSSRNFRSPPAPRQQTLMSHLATSEPIQDIVETPDNASRRVAGASSLGPLVPHITRDSLDVTSEIASRNQPRYLRSSVHVQRATEIPEGLVESDSELTDVTDVPEEQQLESLFRDMPVKGVSKKPVRPTDKPQKKHKVASSKVVRPLEFPVKGNAPAVRLEGNLGKDSAIALSVRGILHAPAQEQSLNTVEKTEKIPKLAIRNELLLKQHRSAAVSVAKNPKTLSRAVVSTEGNLELKEKPGRATRNFPGLSDEVLVIEPHANPEDSSRRDNKPKIPNILGSLDSPAKGRAVKSTAKPGGKSRPLVSGGPIPLENPMGESRIEREDMLKKKTQPTASKITENSHGLPTTLGHTAPKGDPKKPRPAIPNLTWLLDDITPPSTYADKQKVKQRGKLKDRLTGKTGQSEEKQDNAQAAVVAFDPAPVLRPTVVGLVESKLVSPEDTSIWDLPDSEDPEKEDKPLSKNGKGKGNARPKKQASNTKPRAKPKTGPKKRVYVKKLAVTADPKSNELVLDSDEGLESAGERLPVHVPTRNLKPKKDSSKPAATKRVAVQEKEEKKIPVGISKQKAVRKAAPAQMPAKGIAAQDSDDEMGLIEEDKHDTLNLSSKSEFMSISAPTRRVVANQGGDNEVNSGEEQNPPIRSSKLKATRGAAHTSAPAKRVTDWDRLSDSDDEKEDPGPLKKRKKVEQAKTSKAKTVTRPSRPVAKKAPTALKENPKFDIFQNTSQADENSSWRPKTRLQAKMELAAKAVGLTRETNKLATTSIRRSSEKSQETSSSDESLNGSKDTSSPTARPKAQRIPGNSRVLSTGVNGFETMKRNPLLGTEISVEAPTEIRQQGIEAKRTETPRKRKLHSTQKLALEAPARPNTRNHVKWTNAKSEDTTNNHVNSGSNHIGIILGGSPKSNNGSKATGITDLIGSTKQSENISNFSSQEWLVISDDETNAPSIVQSNKNSYSESFIDQPEFGVQLHDDMEMSEESFESQRVEDSRTEKTQEQKLPPITGDQEKTKYQAPTAIMNPVATGSPLVDVNSILFLNGSRDSISPKKKNPKPVLPPVTPKGLNAHSKIPSATVDTLIDDHLTRKAQIISWGNEGPKNQGRTPAAEQRPPYPGGWLEKAEYSIKSKALLRNLGRPLSPDVSENKGEDRIMRRKKSSSFSIYPTRRSVEVTAVENESPSLVTTTQAQAEIVESSEIERELEESNSEDDIYLPIWDASDGTAEASQGSLESTKQESGPPMAIKKLEGSSHPRYIDIRDTSNINADLEMGDVSNKEAERDSVANPPEEVAVLTGPREFATIDGKAPRTHRRGRVNRKISIIEISESSPDETEVEEVRQNEIAKSPIAKTRMPRSLLPKNKPVSISSIPLPTSANRPLGPNNTPSSTTNESLVFQSFLPVVRDISSTLDNDPFTVKSSGNRQTNFFKWLQKTDLKRSKDDNRNGRATHQELSKNLQLEDPDKTLVNEDDFKDTEMSRAGNSEKAPTREQKRGRDPSTTDSDDSSNFSTDFDNSSDDGEDEEDEEDEESSEEDENPQLVWRRSIPDHHGETLSVLDQISQKLLRYLMSGEELAWEVIKDFEKQGNEIVNQLGESHQKEYEEFLVKVKMAKQRMQKEYGAIIKVVESDIAKLQEEKVALANLRAKTNDTYNNLDGTIAMLMARLEGELGVATYML